MTVSTDDKVKFLASRHAYGGLSARDPIVVETHLSWVFLTSTRVYKLKKPLHYPFLDFRTVEARERNCRQEVRLNRRLAPEVYLGVVALRMKEDGTLALGGESGKVADWLVEMRRLPERRMLDHAIAEDTVARSDIETVATLLIDFYRRQPSAELAPDDYVEQFRREHAISEAVLRNPAFDLDQARLDRALGAVRQGLGEDLALLQARVREGRIVEGHGDLRPEHVCLTEPPVIYDCLEFKRALRLVDPFDELAFLSLECERLGAGWIGRLLTDLCAEGLADRPSARLVSFYWAYRACLRARLALAHLLEPNPRHPEKWLPMARDYLALADRCTITQALPADP